MASAQLLKLSDPIWLWLWFGFWLWHREEHHHPGHNVTSLAADGYFKRAALWLE